MQKLKIRKCFALPNILGSSTNLKFAYYEMEKFVTSSLCKTIILKLGASPSTIQLSILLLNIIRYPELQNPLTYLIRISEKPLHLLLLPVVTPSLVGRNPLLPQSDLPAVVPGPESHITVNAHPQNWREHRAPQTTSTFTESTRGTAAGQAAGDGRGGAVTDGDGASRLPAAGARGVK